MIGIPGEALIFLAALIFLMGLLVICLLAARIIRE